MSSYCGTTFESTINPRNFAYLLTYTLSLEFLSCVSVFQEAATARERKRKITGKIEALRFEKTLELAQRQLRETDHVARNAARRELALSLMYRQGSASDETSVQDHTCGTSGSNTSITDSQSSCTRKHELDRIFIDDHVLVSLDKTEQVRTIEDVKNVTFKMDVARMVCTESESSAMQNAKHSGFASSYNVTKGDGVVTTKNFDLSLALPSTPCAIDVCDNRDIVSSAEAVLLAEDTRGVDNSIGSSVALKSPGINKNSSGTFSPVLSPMGVAPCPLQNNVGGINQHVTERTRDPGQAQDKKIVPPPPPRKTGHQIPVESSSGSGLIYENVDGCKPNDRLAPLKTTRPQSVFAVSHKSESLVSSTVKQRPTSEYSSYGLMTSNSDAIAVRDTLNGRSRIAGDKERTATPQNSSVVDKLSAVCCQKDSDSDSSASNDSQTGTIKRTPLTKDDTSCDDKPQKRTIGPSVSRIPPPVPLRKTSTLSTQGGIAVSPLAQHQYSNLQELRRERELLEKQSVSARRQPKTTEPSLTNGNVASSQTAPKPNRLNLGQNKKADRRKCEETEIY